MKKMALIGAAHIHTPQFVNFMKAREDFQVAGVWDHDRARAEKYAEQMGTIVLDSPEQALNDASVDAVAIYSETNLHKELVSKSAAAKKHMFVEKPLGFTAEDATAMAKAITEAGLIFQTGYFMRSSSIHLFLKKQIEAGAFGTITRIRHSNCHGGSLWGWFDGDYRWMANPEISGCGAFGDLGTHSLDIILWLAGQLPKQVSAAIRPVQARYGENCDETGEAFLVFPDGMTATIAAGWMDVTNPVTCEICGTAGHAVVMNDAVYFCSTQYPDAGIGQAWTDLPAALPHAFELFLNAVAGEENVPLVTPAEAADRNIVMEAIYRAAATNQTVTL